MMYLQMQTYIYTNSVLFMSTLQYGYKCIVSSFSTTFSTKLCPSTAGCRTPRHLSTFLCRLKRPYAILFKYLVVSCCLLDCLALDIFTFIACHFEILRILSPYKVIKYLARFHSFFSKLYGYFLL